jgi:hypothetical protein
MEKTAIRGVNAEFPVYACTASRIAELFGFAESTIHLYAKDGALPTLAGNRYDYVWLWNLAIGQKIATGRGVCLSASATVAVGWLHSVGEDIETEDVRAFVGVFERNGFTFEDFDAALDVALAFFDDLALAEAAEETPTCN